MEGRRALRIGIVYSHSEKAFDVQYNTNILGWALHIYVGVDVQCRIGHEPGTGHEPGGEMGRPLLAPPNVPRHIVCQHIVAHLSKQSHQPRQLCLNLTHMCEHDMS